MCLLSAVNGCFTPLKLTAGTWKWVPPWKGDSYCKPSFLPAILVLGPGTVVSGWFHPPHTAWFFFGNKNQQLTKACVKGGTGLLMLQKILLPSLKLTVGGLKMNFLLGPGLFSGASVLLFSPKTRWFETVTFHSAGCSNAQASGSTILEKHISSNALIDDCISIFFWSKDGLETYIKGHIPFPFCFVHEVIFFKIISWHTGQSC